MKGMYTYTHKKRHERYSWFTSGLCNFPHVWSPCTVIQYWIWILKQNQLRTSAVQLCSKNVPLFNPHWSFPHQDEPCNSRCCDDSFCRPSTLYKHNYYCHVSENMFQEGCKCKDIGSSQLNQINSQHKTDEICSVYYALVLESVDAPQSHKLLQEVMTGNPKWWRKQDTHTGTKSQMIFWSFSLEAESQIFLYFQNFKHHLYSCL